MSGCTPDDSEKKYDFFKDMDKYFKFEKDLEENYEGDSSIINCAFTLSGFYGDNVKPATVCRKFKYLTKLIYTKKLDDSPNYNMYLSYWLNAELDKIDNINTCAKFFYRTLQVNDPKFKSEYSSRIKIHDIRENDLITMNEMYILYKKYNEINEIINNNTPDVGKCIQLSSECVHKYKEIESVCSQGNTDACTVLNDFESKYKKLISNPTTISKCGNKPLPALKGGEAALQRGSTDLGERRSEIIEKKEPSDGVNSGSSIDIQSMIIPVFAILGTFIITFILYKFTSFGSWIGFRIKKKKNIWNNIDGESNHSQDISEYEHNIAENISYLISYNSP
ncbi:PIR Superfamily Protein [Plasmodium ovale wallikeri]|uniref:PIR Superfamily Protein n=2 Tax=Plasmodium ovale TaxID=36330 RepID=A0A1A9A5Z6_PLAOA|nr:PIR Superfamily Protein [Plasmodium ovale wallikeri]SBT54069.1 PIR Superfamily Protein [Plasmodium ovale wallikeri]SBT76558.1 PIR protein [Plasmodium ovale]